jgi:hypothetical protein
MISPESLPSLVELLSFVLIIVTLAPALLTLGILSAVEADQGKGLRDLKFASQTIRLCRLLPSRPLLFHAHLQYPPIQRLILFKHRFQL